MKVVLAGCGRIAHTWMNTIKEMPELDIVGFMDIDIEAAKSYRKQYKLNNAVVGNDILDVLKNTNPDIIFDCTAPVGHKNTTITALEYGCHVLGEKPLAQTFQDAKEMVETAQKTGKLYAVMQNRRYAKEIRTLKNFIKSGEIGDLTTLNCDFYLGAHFGGFRDHMKHVLLIDMAIHTFDQARLISGADPVAVYCHEWNPKGSWYDQDASAVCIFEMTDGIVYTYRGSWCAEGCNTTWESDWRAICTKGSMLWDGQKNFKVQQVANDEGFLRELNDIDIQIDESEKSGGHDGCIREFIDCVKNNKIPETICTDNIKSLAMCFAAVESSETGKRVEIKI